MQNIKETKLKPFTVTVMGWAVKLCVPAVLVAIRFILLLAGSLTALKTVCRKVVKFGTLIVVGLNSPLTHLWVSQSEPLAKLKMLFCFKLLNQSTESCVLNSPSKHDLHIMFKLILKKILKARWTHIFSSNVIYFPSWHSKPVWLIFWEMSVICPYNVNFVQCSLYL